MCERYVCAIRPPPPKGGAKLPLSVAPCWRIGQARCWRSPASSGPPGNPSPSRKTSPRCHWPSRTRRRPPGKPDRWTERWIGPAKKIQSYKVIEKLLIYTSTLQPNIRGLFGLGMKVGDYSCYTWQETRLDKVTQKFGLCSTSNFNSFYSLAKSISSEKAGPILLVKALISR